MGVRGQRAGRRARWGSRAAAGVAAAAGLLVAVAALPVAAQTAGGEGRNGAAAAQPSKGPAVRIEAVVSVPPLKGIVEALLPPGSRVQSIIPVGVSEHGYEIPPSRLKALADADLAVYVGLGLEPQVEKFLKQHSIPARRTVEFAAAAGVEAGDGHDHAHHDHAPGEECNHAVDPHLWLDPAMVEKLAAAVRERVEQTLKSRLAGANAVTAVEELNARHAALVERIRTMDERYRSTLGKAERRTIIVAHDAYGWLARRYDLKVVPLAGLTANEPTPAAIDRAVKAVKSEGVSAVFAEPQLPKAAAERVASATGVKLLLLDPLGDGDWFKLMESNLAALSDALGVQGP